MSQKGNYDERDQRKHEDRSNFRSFVWDIGLLLLLTVVPAALIHWIGGMSHLSLPNGQPSDYDERAQRKQEERGEFYSYI